MCSSRWDTPILARRSCALAVRTKIPIAAERMLGMASDKTTSPDATSVRRRPVSRRTVSTELILGEKRLPGKLHAAAIVHFEQLDLHDVALLDDILGLLGAAVLELANVEQSLDARDDFHESAEWRRALDRPLVNPSHLGLGHNRGDHLAGLLASVTANCRNGDEAGVLHVDLGPGRVLNAADRLALRSDHVADLLRLDLDRDDARRILGQLGPRPGHHLFHLLKDVKPALSRPFERFFHDLQREVLDLDVPLDRGDAPAGPRYFEIHVAQGVFRPEDVGQHGTLLALFDQAHGDPGAG